MKDFIYDRLSFMISYLLNAFVTLLLIKEFPPNIYGVISFFKALGAKAGLIFSYEGSINLWHQNNKLECIRFYLIAGTIIFLILSFIEKWATVGLVFFIAQISLTIGRTLLIKKSQFHKLLLFSIISLLIFLLTKDINIFLAYFVSLAPFYYLIVGKPKVCFLEKTHIIVLLMMVLPLIPQAVLLLNNLKKEAAIYSLVLGFSSVVLHVSSSTDIFLHRVKNKNPIVDLLLLPLIVSILFYLFAPPIIDIAFSLINPKYKIVLPYLIYVVFLVIVRAYFGYIYAIEFLKLKIKTLLIGIIATLLSSLYFIKVFQLEGAFLSFLIGLTVIILMLSRRGDSNPRPSGLQPDPFGRSGTAAK